MGRNAFTLSVDETPTQIKAPLIDFPLLNEGAFFVAFGHDAPCGGYFLQIGWDCYESWNRVEVNDHPLYNGDYIEVLDVGFMPGVPKNVVLDNLRKFGLYEMVQVKHPEAFKRLMLDLPC